MIKFHCPNCSQKLGVPEEYANKRVRCSKCGQPCQVPAASASPPPQAAAAAPKQASVQQAPPSRPVPSTPPAAVQQAVKKPVPQVAPVSAPQEDPEDIPMEEDSNPFADLQFDQGPNNEALAAARQERYKEHAKSSQGKTAASGKSSGGGLAAAGAAMGAAKVPLSLAASLGFMIGVCILWTGIGALTGKDFFIFPFCVAGAGAYGLIMFTEKRNVGLGLLSIVMVLLGILIGKVMFAKWVVMPIMQEYLQSEEFKGEIQTFAQLTAEEKKDAYQDELLVYAMGTMQLWNKGQFDETVAKTLILNSISEETEELLSEEETDDSGRESAAKESDQTASDEESSGIALGGGTNGSGREYETEHQAVCSLVEHWTPQQKQQAFEENYDKYETAASQWVLDSNIGKGISGVLAFIGSFSLADLIIIPLSLLTAFKIGNGTNS